VSSALAAGPSAATEAAAARLIAAALADTTGFRRLAYLTDTFGHRLSGSASLEATIDWALGEMRKDGLQKVRGEPVMVPHWVRGAESAALVAPRRAPLHMIGLGGTVGTPPGGITAPVLVVSSFDELQAKAAQARGKIVLFDAPFTTYDETVRYRVGGASAAAKVGAVAALIRSVTPFSMQTPHTGGMRYDSTVAVKVPGAALTVEDAELLHRMQDRGESIVVHLEMADTTLPDAPSRNTVAEIVGSERPDEVVVVSGHLDSWDVGTGAMDDAGGSVAAWQAVKLIQQLGLKPKRTIRVVLWTNEENGTRGGKAYRDAHRAELAKHVAALESDNGVFRPDGFRFQGTPEALEIVAGLGRMLDSIDAGKIVPGEGEADVDAMLEQGVPGLALDVEQTRYFWYHHTPADIVTVLNRDDFNRCVAALAVMAYGLAELPAPLPHAGPAPTGRRR
jgi:carboxypeptidase Q